MKILNVNAQYAGATHDSFIWRNSLVRNEMEALFERGNFTYINSESYLYIFIYIYFSFTGERNFWLLGDSGYPQEPWLMTPFENPLPGTPESRYNDRHIQTRNCVERCIGVLKGRFLCLSKVLRYTPEKVGNIVNACSILHNICVSADIGIDFELIPPEEEHVAVYDNRANRDGNVYRRHLIERYFNN